MYLQRHFVWKLTVLAFLCVLSLALQQQAWASPKKAAEIQPDVIVMTGNAYAVQRFLADEIAKTQELLNVPAIKQGRVFSLPLYVDSSVIEYPAIFAQWQQALEH